MGIIEKIKTWFNAKPQEKDRVNLPIYELENWINKSRENIKKSLKDRSKKIYENLLLLLKQLEEEIIILEKIDISKRKEYEKVNKIT